MDQVFRSNYRIGQHSPHLGDQEGDELAFAVEDLVRADKEEIRDALLKQLIEQDDYWPPDGGEAFYDETECYLRSELGNYHHSELWRSFCESILHRQRFFNSEAIELLSEIFREIHLQRDNASECPVYELVPRGPDSIFTRARIATSEQEALNIRRNPSRELSSPPARKRRPGRMNSAGIATFYAAFGADTCVAELRPAVGASVVTAEFELTRPIYVLDTTRFQRPIKTMSLFAKDYIRRVQQWLFMQNFMREISQPVSPADEYLDYIPTQAVAEYFRYHHEFKKGDGVARIEAIIYQSAQIDGGRNIVLLGDAAEVRPTNPSPERKSRHAGVDDLLPTSMANFLQDRWSAPNAGLQIIEDSLKAYSVGSARYAIIEQVDADSLDF
ncbi:RES family NAD+ phosphorylase [Parvibaculum sp.]|uniref:RES family NAD+ phosphorylase n=1 Tax=Parvibaculum sp. TaxID=2024848 RepID=UPI002600788D|nr:RES family NAD+ phosphorylase [Parvibaculum sp.]